MNIKKILGDVSVAIVAQGIATLVSVMMTLVLPKFLSVEEYGYWQLFIFYIGYAGIFHFGLNDGVYLINGGRTRDEINKQDIKSQFVFSLSTQLAFSVGIMIIAALLPLGEQRGLVLFMVAITLFVNNLALYLGYVFQAMNETRLYSRSAIIESILFLGILTALMLLGETNSALYIIGYVFAKTVRFVYCIIKSRDILSTKLLPLNATLSLCFQSIKVGIKLTLASMTGMLILGVVRFLIDAEWGIETFATVSLSLSMASFIMVFVSQISMVLFPNLRQTNHMELSSFYALARDGLGLFLPAVYILYAPIVFLLTLWLPDYAPSLQLFALLLPLSVFNGKMDIIGITYLKVLRKENLLLLINVVTLAFSTLGCLIGVYLFHSVELTLLTTVCVVVLRCLITEEILNKDLHCKRNNIGIASAIFTMGAIAANMLLPGLFAALILTGAFVIYLLIFEQYTTKALNSIKNVLVSLRR